VSAILFTSPLQEIAFTLRVAISSLHQWFTFVHLSITHLPFLKGFSLSVHHQTFTSPAAQGDLTTLPDIALPMGHYPSSVKELIMAQAEKTQRNTGAITFLPRQQNSYIFSQRMNFFVHYTVRYKIWN